MIVCMTSCCSSAKGDRHPVTAILGLLRGNSRVAGLHSLPALIIEQFPVPFLSFSMFCSLVLYNEAASAIFASDASLVDEDCSDHHVTLPVLQE